MKKITLKIKLILVAPFLTKSTDVGAFGLDYPLAKNEDGKFFFPKKLIKGCLKQAWNEIADVTSEIKKADVTSEIKKDEVTNWFGDKSQFEKDKTNNSVEPERSKIYFSDFVTDQTGDDGTTTRISIDNERGAVDEGALLIIESPFKPQEQIEFEGKIIYFAEDNDWQKIKNRLLKGLEWITNLGALENINFGKLEKVELLNETPTNVNTNVSVATGEKYLDLIITPQEPFCISKRRTTENLFESEIFIPGGVIKGCLAETLNLIDPNKTAFKELRDNLHLIRFTHAFPSKNSVRPVVAPLSLVKINVPTFYDMANSKEAILIGVHPQSPAFSVDWKKFGDVESHFGWEMPSTILSVQTAIENNKAKDGQLYGYEKINPKDFRWLGRIDLSRITDEKTRTTVEGQLRCVLAHDLFGLGKTKALAKTEIFPENTISNKFDKRVKSPPDKLIITLQTPFLLCNLKELNESSGQDALFEKYKETLETLFKDSVTLKESATLSHFFASQSLAGGEYLHKRFQSDKAYNPFLLTDAGSVFVFDVTDQTKADSKIDDWLKHGLPLPDWAKELYLKGIAKEDYWKHLPFLPENGFGEIAVNLDIHWDNAPKPTEVTEI